MTSETYKDKRSLQEIYFRVSGTGNSPWELGRAQSVIIKLVEQGVFHDNVLDISCDIADNTIYIVTHTNNVHLTAIDLVPKVIEVSRQKAKKTVFHAFSNEDRQCYIKNVQYLIKPGDFYIELVLNEKEKHEDRPRQNGWTIESIEDTIYQTNPPFLEAFVQAYLSFIRRNKLV